VITVVDYGVGNISALLNMFEHLGCEARATNVPAEIVSAHKLVLPGVGAFDKAMSTLRRLQLEAPLNEAVQQRRVPILGVCLGMQLLARGSEEGVEPGLGWIEADVRRIPIPAGSQLKVPHIGWSDVTATGHSALFPRGAATERFYFVHGYHMVCDRPADVAATFDHGTTLACSVGSGTVFGVQFHPEKSHRFGMRVLRSFANFGNSDE
jgi:glutamine amidotransferase